MLTDLHLSDDHPDREREGDDDEQDGEDGDEHGHAAAAPAVVVGLTRLHRGVRVHGRAGPAAAAAALRAALRLNIVVATHRLIAGRGRFH